MVEIEFVNYDENTHKTEYIDMFMEYGKGFEDQVVSTNGVHLIPNGDIQKLADRLVPLFTSYDPSEGVLRALSGTVIPAHKKLEGSSR